MIRPGNIGIEISIHCLCVVINYSAHLPWWWFASSWFGGSGFVEYTWVCRQFLWPPKRLPFGGSTSQTLAELLQTAPELIRAETPWLAAVGEQPHTHTPARLLSGSLQRLVPAGFRSGAATCLRRFRQGGRCQAQEQNMCNG